MPEYTESLTGANELDAVVRRLVPVLRRRLEVRIERRCGFTGPIRRRDRAHSLLLDVFHAIEIEFQVAA